MGYMGILFSYTQSHLPSTLGGLYSSGMSPGLPFRQLFAASFPGSHLSVWPSGLNGTFAYRWLAGDEGMEKKREITIVGYVATPIGIHSFIPS